MPDRLEAALLFGSLGNLADALGEGWSVEDEWAWAVGIESQLTVALPGDDASYRLRLTVDPLLQPGVVDAQRLSIATEGVELASFTLSDRQTIEVPLPLPLTTGRSLIGLTLVHPDTLRPSDFKNTPDSRWLTLCFHSGALARQADVTAAADADLPSALIVGGDLARQIAEIMRALPALRGKLAFHHVDADQQHADRRTSIDATQAAAAALCWEQSDASGADDWVALRPVLPSDCALRRFATPRMRALWPFVGSDSRLVTEPGLYRAGRYPFGDTLGVSLANMSLPDDVIMLAYENMAEKAVADLDRLLDNDVARWRKLDATHDVQVADFILQNFRAERLHFAPPFVAGPLLRHIVDQLIVAPPIDSLCDSAALKQELDFLLSGYIGRREELPIDPHVARHFGLAWWQPDMCFRWFGNNWTFGEYALRYIRWTPWRP